MRSLITLFFVIFFSTGAYAQLVCYNVKYKALDVGVYDYSKVPRNRYKVFYGEQAQAEVEKLFPQDEELRKCFMYDDGIDEQGNQFSYPNEIEIIEYYPEVGIVAVILGPGDLSVFDIRRKITVCGHPSTYAFSPSGRYRISGLDFDGWSYYLEEKKDGDYVCLGEILFEGTISGYYWVDDSTIHYLKEYTKSDGSIYWIGYSAKFQPPI